MKIYSFVLAACLIFNAGFAIAAENAVSTYTETSSVYKITASWQRFGISLPDRLADERVANAVAQFRAHAQELNDEGTPPWELNLEGTLYSNGATISMLWNHYEYIGGAHGGIILSSQNHVLPGGEPLTLADIFPHKEKALKIISELSRKKLLAQDLPADMVTMGTEPKEENFCTFVLGNNDITFYFSPYQVAPFSEGTVTVSLSLGELVSAAPNRRFWK